MQNVNEQSTFTVSIVIRVRNAAKELAQCLKSIERQILPPQTELEIVVVDNESTDGSDRVARLAHAAVVNISCRQFSWGRALNRGIEVTRGELVILLSADALPANRDWLAKMLAPFSDSKVQVVYGRQIPYPNATVDERVRLQKYFSAKAKQFSSKNCQTDISGRGIVASNACAAFRRSIWQQIRFDEEIEAGEEGPWVYNVIGQGHTIVYQPLAKVFHSHRDSAFQLANRHWELFRKKLRLTGIRLNGARILRWILSFIKRRLSNCVQPNIPFLVRVKGIVVLPIEVIAFAAVGFCPEKYALKLRLSHLFQR